VAAHTIRISILALLLSLPLSASAQDGPALDDVVNGLQAFYEKTDSFKADFTQEVKRRYKPGEGVKRSGTVYFMKPGKMRWDYKTPEPVYYVSDGETLWVYEPRENVAYRGDIKGSRMASTMKFLFGAGKLRDEFEITMGEAPSEGTIALEMMPRNGEQGYKKLVLVVDAKTYEIRESRLTDPADDTSTIAFSGQTYAPIKNPEWFTWKPSDGVRIEDLSKLRE
jgi:outer membrane lipoprotein carrier protein